MIRVRLRCESASDGPSNYALIEFPWQTVGPADPEDFAAVSNAVARSVVYMYGWWDNLGYPARIAGVETSTGAVPQYQPFTVNEAVYDSVKAGFIVLPGLPALPANFDTATLRGVGARTVRGTSMCVAERVVPNASNVRNGRHFLPFACRQALDEVTGLFSATALSYTNDVYNGVITNTPTPRWNPSAAGTTLVVSCCYRKASPIQFVSAITQIGVARALPTVLDSRRR